MSAPQPISLADVAALFDVLAITGDDRRRFLNIIATLDDAWLVQSIKKQKENEAPSRPRSGRSARPRGRGASK